MNCFFFHSHPTLMSFCTKGLPGVAESTVSKSDKTFSLEGEGSLKTIIPHTQGEGTFCEDGFCDFAFGSAQNDRG